MKHRWAIAIALAILVIAALVFRYNTQPLPKTVSKAKLKIISLAPSITEILFELEYDNNGHITTIIKIRIGSKRLIDFIFFNLS